MSKLIAGGYLIETDDAILATGTKSIYEDVVVQIKKKSSKRLDHLVHNAFLRRAKEMVSLKNQSLVRLIYFGYDVQTGAGTFCFLAENDINGFVDSLTTQINFQGQNHLNAWQCH